MKICNKCNAEKELNEFNNNKNQKDGKQRTCRECTKQQHLNWYILNQKIQIEKNKKVNKNKKNKFLEYKKTCECSKCKDKRWYVLDFHHKDPKQKEFGISSNYILGNKKFWNEVKKCVPLCRNCHSEFHHLERENNITIEEYLK